MATLGKDVRAIWIATNPRTGSMWTANVTREIVRAEGFDPLPGTRSVEDREIAAFGVRHLSKGHPGVAVLKVHAPVPAYPDSVGIVTQRDVRDASMSFMRFMRLSFDEVLAGYATSALACPPEKLFAGAGRLLLDYTTIRDTPAEAVRSIATFLGAERAATRSEEIAAKFTKAAVKRRIDAAESELRARAKDGRVPANDPGLVVLSPTNWRARDIETDFQSGHVSDYRDGDWRWLLTAEQQAAINALIEASGRSMV